ncbi:MAG: hypothetical protein Q9211_003712 [Gyalolechia sp. 1 TL-2023]
MSSYQQTLAQLFWKAVEDPEFLQSIKSHKRIIHGLIVAQFVLPYPFGNLQLNPVCPDCHRKHRTTDGETYALLHDEDDIESHAAGANVNDGEATARTRRQQPDL